MNKIIEQIEKIREINKQHKLVIFVGAGVSKNSGVCSWWELVKDMAIKINYNDICETCKMKNLICNECGNELELCSFDNYNCQYKYNFSSDEFLKIPQYFFDIKGEDEYYTFLDEKFNQIYEPNVIDELIVDISPEHIITTNYDHLIEDVKNPNRSKYTKITSDKDILKKYGKRYIIKMHGDIDDTKNIVLKEDDYLKYSLKHELLETYIKSLLIDKTFLFVGYSLNDNNLNLIMSYIDYFAKDKEIKRSNHYLATNEIVHKDRDTKYWSSKGVELINLSQVTELMKENTKSDLSKLGKPLYTFLKYIKDDRLPYSNDKITVLKRSLYKNLESLIGFNYISYSTIFKVCNFRNSVEYIDGSLAFYDKEEYENIKSVLDDNSHESKIIKEAFLKSGITSIYYALDTELYFDLNTETYTVDNLFELSLKNKYSKIAELLKDSPDNLEKAYYYFLIYRHYGNICKDTMKEIEKEINSLDYSNLSNEDKYKIAVFEFNSISIRLLTFQKDNRHKWDRLEELLDTASTDNKAFDFIRNLYKNGEILNRLNNSLIKHEEYYMRKSSMTKFGGTIYGDLFKLQAIVYDYYLFYKKNFLMLDWFNNVEKVCEPYIKAILCTYYPDEYQYSNYSVFGRTRVETYPITLIDIDMIVKHSKYKDFCSWISYYKVFSVNIEEDLDISELFSDFCVSMTNLFNINSIEQLKVFSKLLSLVKLTNKQKHRIVIAFIHLNKPDETTGVNMLRNNLIALWTFIEKHYDENDYSYKEVLLQLINIELIKEPLGGMVAYQNIINRLLPNVDKKIYESCCDLIDKADDERTKALIVFIYRKILLKFDFEYWQKWIINHIEHNWTEEIYKYLYEDIITYDNNINQYFQSNLKKHAKSSKVKTYPDHESQDIGILIVLLLEGKIENLSIIEFIKEYSNEYPYIDFLFNPESFDYSKIDTADYMWCNLINNNKYRDLILNHKNDFWHKDDEKRISLGFGDDFENRVVYKYLID